MVGLGIPKEQARLYSDRINRGSFLVMVTGTKAEITRAEPIMRCHGVEEFAMYDIPGAKVTTVADGKNDIQTKTDIANSEKT